MTEADKGLPGEDTIKPPHLSQQAFSLVVNPRRACAARVTVVAVSVCVCVSVCRENTATCSAGDKGQIIVAFSLKLLRCRDRALPPLNGHTYNRPYFLRITHLCKICDMMLGLHALLACIM